VINAQTDKRIKEETKKLHSSLYYYLFPAGWVDCNEVFPVLEHYTVSGAAVSLKCLYLEVVHRNFHTNYVNV
jgi:hypothetical protein